MKPKFELGQKVKTKDGSVYFEIDEIQVRKDEIRYPNPQDGYYYPENELELVIGSSLLK